MNENTRFAKNEFNDIIEAKKGMNKEHTFTCLGCGEVVGVYAINTKVQAAHFRHTGNTGTHGGCGNYESYIHNFSKRKFAELYINISSLELKRSIYIKCNQAKHSNCTALFHDAINLKERYPYIKLEQRDGSFIPDCLIYNGNGDKVYIEIKYKSSISEEKKNSGIPIIEIDVTTEDDILGILNCGIIDSSAENINLFNSDKIAPNSVYDCAGVCHHANSTEHTEHSIHLFNAEALSKTGTTTSIEYDEDSIKRMMNILSNKDRRYAMSRLDSLKEYFLESSYLNGASLTSMGWYLDNSHENIFYRKNTRYYQLLYDFKYYGMYEFGGFHVYTVRDNKIVFICTTKVKTDAHRTLEEALRIEELF